MRFTTSLDGGAKAITIATTVVFSVLVVAQTLILQPAMQTSQLPVLVVLLIAYGCAFLFRPLAYELTAEKILIRRPIGRVAIHRRRIISAELIDRNQLGRTFRICGAGGLFGYFGKFANGNFGSLTLYATRRDRTVLIRIVGNKKIILTPDEPELFVRHLRDGR